jgi:type I restriction-modification system DNA methylase subunit/signal transduction histidine kinase
MTRDSEIEKSNQKLDLGIKLFWNGLNSLRGDLSPDESSVLLFFLLLKKQEFNISGVEISRLKSSSSSSIIENIALRSKTENRKYLLEIYKYFKPVISRIDIKNIEKMFLNIDETCKKTIYTNFEDVFENLLFFWSTSSNRNNYGQMSLPYEISRFISQIANVQNNDLVYNPFAGIASFNINIDKEIKYVGQELNQSAYIIGLMRLMAHNKLESSSLLNDDSITNWNPSQYKYDLIISNPPFGFRLSTNYNSEFGNLKTAEGFLLEKGLRDLNKNGKLVALVSPSVLFIPGAEKLIRKHIIDNDLLEYVISFPQKLLSHTGIATSLVVINKNKVNNGVVKFIDAEKYTITLTNKNRYLEYAKLLKAIEENNDPSCVREISNAKIAEDDYNLNAARYFINEAEIEEGVVLTKIKEFGSELNTPKSIDGDEGLYVTLKDLKNDKVNYHLTADAIEKIDLTTRTQIIEESCLLIASRGTNLKPTYFDYNGKAINISFDIVAIKIDFSKVDIDYLINELHSEYVTEQLHSVRYGVSIPTLQRKDLFQIKIKLLPLLVDQRNAVKSVKEALLQAKLKEIGLEDELERIRKAQKDDLSIKKHNIMQHLNNVKESADLLMQLMNRNNGTLNVNTVINPNLNTNVGTRFNRMIESINDALFFVDNLTNEIEFEKREALNIDELLKEAIEKGINKPELFKLDYSYDASPFIVWDTEEAQEENIEPIIDISKKAIFEIYNNILENAIRHGFTDISKKYVFSVELQGSLESNKVQISFSNNGYPFPEGIAERFCIKGEKAGKTGNTGIGTWKVCEIVKHYGGSIEVLDLKEEDFPVKINITFPLKSYLTA